MIAASLGLVSLSGAFGVALTTGQTAMTTAPRLPDRPAITAPAVVTAALDPQAPARAETPRSLVQDTMTIAAVPAQPRMTTSPRPEPRVQAMARSIARTLPPARDMGDDVAVTALGRDPLALGGTPDIVDRALFTGSLGLSAGAETVVPGYMIGVFR